jgi:4-amino-4-deoxy-L-arabinose transferase-like glycosyltransferase
MWRALLLGSAEILCPLLVVAATVYDLGTPEWRDYAGRDVEIYVVVARYWQDGLLPYRDLYDFKPPLTYVALRTAWAVWEPGAESLRRLLMLAAAAGALVAYAGLRRARLVLAAPATAIGFLTLAVADPWRVVSQNTELVAAPFGIAAFGCAVAYQHGARWPWALGSGVCVGLAMLAKQPAALWLVPVVLQVWMQPVDSRRRRDWMRAAVRRTLLVVAGGTVPIGAVVLYFAWHGAASDLIEATVTDGIRYAGLRSDLLWAVLARPTADLLRQVTTHAAMWPFVGAVLAMPLLTLLRPSRAALAAWAWLLVSYAVVVVGPRSEWHYLMCAFPALALTLGTVIELALAAGEARPSARRLVGGTIVAVLLVGGAWTAHALQLQPLGGRSPIADLAEQIRNARQPGDTLFVKDEPYLLYAETGMRPLTRIFYPDAPTAGALETWVGVLARRPTFICVSHGTEGRLPSAQQGFEGDLARVLAQEYQRWVVHPIGVVYRRK